jgi:hypothetical protein
MPEFRRKACSRSKTTESVERHNAVATVHCSFNDLGVMAAP